MTPEILRPEQNLRVALGNRQMDEVYIRLPRGLIPQCSPWGAWFFGSSMFADVQATIELEVREFEP